MKHIAAVIIVTAVLLFTQTYASAWGEEKEIPQLVDMKPVAEEPKQLYALSAVLMDGILVEYCMKEWGNTFGKCQHHESTYL